MKCLHDLRLADPRIVVDGVINDAILIGQRGGRRGEREAVGQDREVLPDGVAAKDAQPGVEVGDGAAGNDGSEAGEHPLGGPTHERNLHVLAGARSDDHIRLCEQVQHDRQLVRGVGAVCVDDADGVVGRRVDACLDGGAVAAVLKMPQHASRPAALIGECCPVMRRLHRISCGIRVAQRSAHRLDLRRDSQPLVVGRDNHRHALDFTLHFLHTTRVTADA